MQRLFEDEQELYLENTHTGAVSRVFLESNLTPLATRVAAQQTTLNALTCNLQALRAEQVADSGLLPVDLIAYNSAAQHALSLAAGVRTHFLRWPLI